MTEAVIESLHDSIRLIPFLLVTYLAVGFIEHAGGARAQKAISSAGKVGPLWGGLLGVIPQCGFSAAASYFYVGKVINLGTLIAVYLSTSDEMLPIFISEHVPVKTIAAILTAKAVLGIVSGFAAELIFGWLVRKRHVPKGFEMEPEHHHGAGSVVREAVVRTFQVFLFILIISVIIECAIELVGQDAIAGFFHGTPVLGEFAAALVGLIPNCAASVVITQLYTQGIIGAGPMMSGLLASAGVGLLVLFRENTHVRQNIAITVILYAVSVFWGIVIELTGITF